MSKRILWVLTISLSLAMTGLILVQFRWISNAFSLNEKQFQQLVNTTLTDFSRQMEHFYMTRSMTAMIDENAEQQGASDWNIVVEEGDRPVFYMDEDSLREFGVPVGPDGEAIMEVINDSLIVISHVTDKGFDTITLSSTGMRGSAEELEQAIRQQEYMVKSVMKKMLLEDITFEDRVSQQELEELLGKNLQNKGILLDFEYSVIRNNKKEVYSSPAFSKKTGNYYFRTGLLGNRVMDQDNYLYLYFPKQKEYIRSSLGYLGTATFGLTLLMILLFSFALYVIFKQKKLSDIKNDFVNNMTHELKTPISTISLASQMLNDDSIPVERKNTGHIARIIQAESKRLGYQVERVLQMAVLDQGHLVLKKSPLGMSEIIGTVVQNFKLQVESRNGKLSVIDESDADIVNGDRVHLMNVVTNLLDNAVKYSKDKPEISIHMSSINGEYTFSVSDRGIGISKENQRKVFERFFRVSTGNVHDVKGFGLGLSYVKLIVEQHEGDIQMSSELNKGTTFTVSLPLYKEN